MVLAVMLQYALPVTSFYGLNQMSGFCLVFVRIFLARLTTALILSGAGLSLNGMRFIHSTYSITPVRLGRCWRPITTTAGYQDSPSNEDSGRVQESDSG